MANPIPPPLSALEARLGLPVGSLDGEDKARAEAALSDATSNALSEVPDAFASAWATACPAVVWTIILKAARREYDNPQGLSMEVVGAFTAATSVTSGAELTASESARVKRAWRGSSGSVYTVRTGSAYE